jgi:beta-galactosidase
MSWRCLWAALLWLLATHAALAESAARVTTPLDVAWHFHRADAPGAQAPDFDDAAWPIVTLPHTYNAVDGEAGGAYYRGPAWYRRTLELPAAGARRRFLEFDGAALAADVWVNGHHAGRHEGGYARFRFDVTALLHTGTNTIAVRVDNGPLPDVAPLGGDFTVFGGLYRSVRLVETAPLHIDLLDAGGPGVEISTASATPRSAQVGVRVHLRNDLPAPQRAQLLLTLRDAAGHAVLEQREPLKLPPHADTLAAASVQLPHPNLWQGVAAPYLYRLTVELQQGGVTVDAVSQPVGVRTVAFDADRGLLLNGQPYPLHGAAYFHPERPGQGPAVTDAQIDEDAGILQELGATGLRLVHFQHPQRVYQQADQLGFVLWTEIPLNSKLNETAAFRANLAQQLHELIQQNRNHPSVAIWGVGNEVYRSDDIVVKLLAALNAQAHREDPTRPTAYAHCCAPDDHPMALQTDLTGYNRYWGWYDGELSDFGPWADRLHAKLPQRALIISEYGAGASVLQQQDPPQRPVPASHWHPEQYQARFHEAYWAQIAARPWIAGSFVWVAFDLPSAGRNEGDRPGFNDKGLVTYDRKMRKDAYYFYRAHWSRTPMVHIASARLTPRPAGPTAVRVYTNTRHLTLAVNGVVVGTANPVDRIAVWPDVRLVPGRNEIDVRSDDAGVRDTVVWEGTS